MLVGMIGLPSVALQSQPSAELEATAPISVPVPPIAGGVLGVVLPAIGLSGVVMVPAKGISGAVVPAVGIMAVPPAWVAWPAVGWFIPPS